MVIRLLRLVSKVSKESPVLSHIGLLVDADLRFHSPQPDTSLHCDVLDTSLRIACCACLLPGESQPRILPIADGSPKAMPSQTRVVD